MTMYKPYAIDSIWWSILSHQVCRSNNCSNRYNLHHISLFGNPDEPINTISQPCRLLYFDWITTAYSWGWGHYFHWWDFLQCWEKVAIMFPAGSRSWHWSVWLGGVQLKYTEGQEGTRPWKVLSRSLSVYWTQMLWDSGMIPWFALVYSTWQSGPRRSTDVRQWNGWR